MKREKEFSELTRVQIPAALHLMRLGYTYLPHNGKELNERDPETNILVSIFREQFLKFNNYGTGFLQTNHRRNKCDLYWLGTSWSQYLSSRAWGYLPKWARWIPSRYRYFCQWSASFLYRSETAQCYPWWEDRDSVRTRQNQIPFWKS